MRRITRDPKIFGGKPIIRGMRVSVELVLSLLAQGANIEGILDDYPDLEPDDIRACLVYAHAVIAHHDVETLLKNTTKYHDLFDFMSQITHEIETEYKRIRKRASEDPGTAGDQGEENWAALPRDWLPPAYRIVTKGRLIGHDNTSTPQVDIVVLKPSYPPKLVDKKLYLAGGVAAAFECKLTLTAAGVAKAIRNAIAVKSLFTARIGSPYRELRAPIIYGLLAHSHSWKAPGSNPLSNIEKNLREVDSESVSHPRLGLALVCVPNLALFTSCAWTFIGPSWVPKAYLGTSPIDWKDIVQIYGPEGSAATWYINHSKDTQGQSVQFTPIGMLIYYIIERLAWEDPACRSLADYYRRVSLGGPGTGLQRLWPATIYSDEVRDRVVRGMLGRGDAWDEWSGMFE